MRYLGSQSPATDLTYGDVFLVPSRSAVTSRFDVDLAAADGTGATIPIAVANMTAVSGRRMAETSARRGAISILPQDIPVDVVRDVVASVKAKDPVVETPVTVDAAETVSTLLTLLSKRSHGAAVVVSDGRPVGVATAQALAGFDRFTQVGRLMSTDFVSLPQGDLARDGVEATFERLVALKTDLAVVTGEAGSLLG
ncbi:MAG: IMP dehydrogenase, partial [Promicromonosporaceae bacterium]|nr:IMP dehydrogenase [Promicromonosporaceae bacterium]